MCGYTVAQNPPSVRIWPVRASECSAGQGDSGSGIVTKMEMEDFMTKKVWKNQRFMRFDKVWGEKKTSISDKALIEHLEKVMPEKEKISFLFSAYKGSTKPEEERTDQERYNYTIAELAFNLVKQLAIRNPEHFGAGIQEEFGKEKTDFRSVVEPILNETFDGIYSAIHLRKGKPTK